MTVQSDLKKAIAAAEAAKGTYAMVAEATEDHTAKEKYHQMCADMDDHLMFLNSRVSYLDNNNSLNQQLQQE